MRALLGVVLWSVVVTQTAIGASGIERSQTAAKDPAVMVGRAADIAPSAYLYRSDRASEENPPETAFLFGPLGHKRASVVCGLLWEEPRPVERVELIWPEDAKELPRAEDVVVRWLPHGNSSSWWSRRAAGGGPPTIATAEVNRLSEDGRTYVYAVDAARPETAMDNLVLVLQDGASPPAERCPVPTVRVITTEPWKLVDVEIEWGFQAGTEKLPFDGQVEAYNGLLGRVMPLAEDGGTTVRGDSAWQSSEADGPRRGIALQVLYMGRTQNTRVWREQARLEDANRTIVTVRTRSGSFSFLPADLETGPILAPEFGFFVRATGRRDAPTSLRPRQVPSLEEMLTEKVDAVAGSPAIRGWGSNETPWFGANPAEQSASVSTFTLPGRSVAMHPAPHRPVACGWRSPIRGRIAVNARVEDADPSGGNGIEWSLTQTSTAEPRVLARGVIDNGGKQSIPAGAEAAKPKELAVEPGDLVSLVVASRGGEHTCDTTVVEMTVTQSGGMGRAWNLTKEVVDSVQSGNPHADALGNSAVWHFYSPEREPDPEPVIMASQATSARQFLEELSARGLKTIRQRVRDHAEQTWAGAMEAMHPGGNWPPYPQPEFEPPAKIDVPEPRLNDAWRCGAWNLLRVLDKDDRGRYVMRDYPYDALAHESCLIIRALDLQGMHEAARDGLARWLEVDPTRPMKLDGLFPDTTGALSGVEWDWQHAGGPGIAQWQMAEHYRFTGDKEWLARAAPKLQAHSDWMARQRRDYPKDVPGRERLWTHGLLPPHNIWDSTNWRPWYESNANYCLGLRRYAEAISEIDPATGKKYLAEAEAYAKDILAAVERSFVLSPVVRVRDGTYRSFLPPAPYIRGPASRSMPTSFGSPEHTPGLYADAIRGGVHLVNLSGLLPASDRRAQGLVDVLEDRLLMEHHRLPMRTPGYDPDEHWFSHAGWYYQCGIERTANVHLQWDDAPNFLRSFYNQYAVNIVVGPYTHNEHTTRGPPDKSFEEAVFLERLRNMLVMEEGDSLWIARGTPRAWLKQGGRVAANKMPTHFGPVGFEIISDVTGRRISAMIQVPSRRPAKEVLLRLRHPTSAAIQAVRVNGREWNDLDSVEEVVRLRGMTGEVRVDVTYAK